MNVAKVVMSSDQHAGVHPEHLDHPPGQRRLDLVQLLHGDRVHRVGEPAMIQRPGPDPGDRPSAVLAHHRANARLERGSQTRFTAANPR